MNIIDFHTHAFPDKLAQRALAALKAFAPGVEVHTDGTVAGLQDSMRDNGITRSVLLPIATKPEQVATINKGCAGLMSAQCIPFGTLHPSLTNFEAEIRQLKNVGVKGIKFHPEYQDFYIDDPRLFPMYELLSSQGFIVVIHAGRDPGPFTCDHALPPAFSRVLRNFPNLVVVAAHMGGWKVWDEVEKLLIGQRIFLDTSAVKDFMPSEEFIRLVRKHGVDQILFGTDSPWFHQGAEAQWIENLNLSFEEREKILHKNAERLLADSA